MSKIIEKNSGYVLGIDLGTTNSAVAVFKSGAAEHIPIEASKTMPSVVSVLRNGDMLVGNSAKGRSIVDPDNTVSSIKRKMGENWEKEFDGLPDKKYTPTDLSVEILSKIKNSIDENIIEGTAKYAVICVPANFDDAKKKATKKAAELANFSVLWLLEEPVAASYAYALERKRDQTILVYDLGGGTFDVTILKLNSTDTKTKRFNVLAKEGIPDLGGDDFDQRLMKRVANDLMKHSGLDILNLKKDQGISVNKLLEAQQKLKDAVSNAKHELTESLNAVIDIPNIVHDEEGAPHHIDNFELSRDHLNEEIGDLVQKTIDTVQTSLDNAKLTVGDIDRIILVGGSTKIPLVKEMIEKAFKKEPYSDTDPDTAIAKGAAIFGATLTLPADADTETIPEKPNFEFFVDNIVTHHLGIETFEGLFSCLIDKGTDIPEKEPVIATGHYVTPRDNMTELAIRVYQSSEQVEYISSEEVKFIGEFFLTGIPPKPKGQEKIIVHFEIDAQNVLKVTANSSSSSKSLEIKSE